MIDRYAATLLGCILLGGVIGSLINDNWVLFGSVIGFISSLILIAFDYDRRGKE